MMSGPWHAIVFVTGAIVANVLIAAAASGRVTEAVDTAILAVLVLLLDHLRERERSDRARHDDRHKP